VVLKADVGEVDIAKLISRIERDEEIAVPQGKVARH